MDLHFYFDTAVLGPTYEDGYRHLVLSVSAAWEGGEPPGDERLQALLQPWRWITAGCTLYRAMGNAWEAMPGSQLKAVALDDGWSPGATDLEPVTSRLRALYARCKQADTSDPHHRFSLGAIKSGSDSEEAPDLRNGQHWPDLLASAGRWPGLLPYRLNLQIAFRVKADAIASGALYFIMPEQISTDVDQGAIVSVDKPELPDNGQVRQEDGSEVFTGQGEATIEYRWASDAAGSAIAKGRIGGRAAPVPEQAKATGALLDLATLWGCSDAAGGWTSHDWFAAVPGLVAEAFDQPDLLFDVLSELAVMPAETKIPSVLAELFLDQSKRENLLDFATSAWLQRYGALRRRGGDGNHPLLSVLRAVLADDYDGERMDALPGKIADELSAPTDVVQRRLDIFIRTAAVADDGKLALALPFIGGAGDGLDKREGLDFLREAARTFAWLVSDAGLFAIYRPWWLPVVEAVSTAQSPIAEKLSKWLASEASDAYPMAALVRECWATHGDQNVRSPVQDTVDALHAEMSKDKTSAVDAGKSKLVALLSDVIDRPLPANTPLRDCLQSLGLIGHPVLETPLHAALGSRVKALARRHLDGDARAGRPELVGYPFAFGDPWPLDRVHDLMLPIDRPGHVDSDDDNREDLRRQIAGIGLLVCQEGKRWYSLASAAILPEGSEVSRYEALSGQPSAFAGELRTTMVAYRGEPWFERDANEALAVGYDGEPEADSALTDVRAMAHPDVKFPDLKFGQNYFCKPFIIGPGNALPSELCAGPEGARLHPAHPRDELFSSVGIAADVLATAFGPFHYLRRVPVGAPLLEPGASDTLFSRRDDVHPLAHEVLAATTPSEEPLTLLCPSEQWRGQTRQIFHLQPPEVDMMVWLRHWRALISANDGGAPGKQWPEQLTQTLATWMAQADAIAARPEGAKSLPKFHDPAHDAYLIEVEQVWPRASASRGFGFFPVEGIEPGMAAVDSPGGRTRPMDIRILADAEPVLSVRKENDDIVISGVQAGCVYRVSASALVKAGRFAEYDDVGKDLQGKKFFAPVQIFGQSVAPAKDAVGYIRFATRTLLAEVATEKMPQTPTIGNVKASELEKARASALERALMPAFDGRTLTVSADFSEAGVEGWEYARSLILERQRWAWNGRHVDRAKIDALVPSGDDRIAFVPKDADGFESWGFHGRSDDDHVREFAASAANDPRTVVWREDLHSRRAAEYHRFRLRARSRYAGLMGSSMEPESFAGTWAPFALKFRLGATTLPRPKIAMLLPLTGGYDDGEGGRKLACLVQLEESAFDESGLPERIEVKVEMVGPDPILIQARPTSALKLDCKTHGPIGHSFDPDLPGAKYRRASWVASFDTPAKDAATGHPWPLVKLRVRREVPKGWVWPLPQNDLESETVSAGWIQLPRPWDQILVRDEQSSKPRPVVASDLHLRRGPSDVSIVYDGTTKAVALDREPGFDGLFPVLTYQVIDARGIPGGERIIDINPFDIGKAGPIRIATEALQTFERAPPGSLRLRLLTVQQNPRIADDRPTACNTLSELFGRVGEDDTSDAWFRLMRVSLPIMES